MATFKLNTTNNLKSTAKSSSFVKITLTGGTITDSSTYIAPAQVLPIPQVEISLDFSSLENSSYLPLI